MPETEEAPAEEAKEEVPPNAEPYEIELDEDSPLSDEEFDEIVAEAERLNLSKEDAEKLIQMREYSHKASREVFEQENKKRIEKMVSDYKSETSLQTPEAKSSMREAIKAFGKDDTFKEMFKDPAMNFNVALAKFLVSVGDKIRDGENNMPTGKSHTFSTNDTDPRTRAANNFYKDM